MLGQEIDLLRNYPKSKRDTKGRAKVITEADREIARQYGKDFTRSNIWLRWLSLFSSLLATRCTRFTISLWPD